MANGHGGARPGAGRKPGSATRVDRELRERALEAEGDTPLEYMLRVMRDPETSALRRDDMAKAAAPYLHSRLQSVSHTGADGGNITVEIKHYDYATAETPAPK